MEEKHFLAGDYDIGYLDRVGDTVVKRALTDGDLAEMAVAAALAEDESRSASVSLGAGKPGTAQVSAWLLAARQAGLRPR
jgi:hypothetical protein